MNRPVPAAPRRRGALPPLRRLSRNVLVIGTVVALVAACGPVWAVRVGVLVAVAAAVSSVMLAWRELAEARHQHAAEMLAASKKHGSALRNERRQHAGVVDVLTDRSRAAAAEIAAQQDSIVELTSRIIELTAAVGSLRAELSTLHGDHAFALTEIRQRESAIASLEETVQAREAELRALSEAGSQVRAIPRRLLTEPATPQEQAPHREELWPDDRHPDVWDLSNASIVLPNYEGDRKLA